MKKILAGFAGFASLIGGLALAATFNLFSPAAGVLKGNPSTYVTTAAAASDIYGLWGGTCSASTFLRGDGTCTTPTGTTTGANPSASVGLSAVNGAASTYMRSDGAPALSQAITPTWSATHTFTLAPIFSSLNGIIKGNGASAASLATSANVLSLWTGTCSASTFLRGDGTCAAGAGGSGANPTALVGLTAVNGVAASFIRSDGAPALDQNIAPTWTGVHTFTSSNPSVKLAATIPVFYISEIGAATDAKKWREYATSSHFLLGTLNDAESVEKIFFDVGRSGTTITSIALGNVTDAAVTTVNSTSARPLDVNSSGGAASYMGFNASGVAKGYTGFSNSTAGLCTGDIAGDYCIRAVSGKALLSTNNGASSKAFVVGSTSTAVPVIAFAKVSVSGGVCSLTVTNGFSGCTYNSAGSYNLTPTSLSNNTPCTATADPTGTGAGRIVGTNASAVSVSVSIYNFAGTLTDATFSITCMTQ